MKIVSLIATIALGFSALGANAESANSNDAREGVFQELSFIKSVFSTGYAPAQWKKQQFNWSIDTAFETVLAGLSTKSELSAQDYRDAIRQMVGSTRDYHVSAGFTATESATLPLLVMSAEGKYLIASIKREKLSDPEVQVGDEIISWNGKPIADAVADMKAQTQWSVAETDDRLAERYLTNRFAVIGMKVPQGRVDLELKRGDKVFARQLVWEYTPEAIQWGPMFSQVSSATPKSVLREPQMTWGVWSTPDANLQNNIATSFRIGSRTSFVPTLGSVIWRSDDSNTFDAYIYRQGGNLIGYVRIPHYGMGTTEFLQFRDIISRMQATTDALVIDQVSNPGGSVFFVYALMSVLSDRPMRVPAHHVALWPEMVGEILQTEKQMSDVKSDADAVKVIGTERIGGYPVNYQLALGFLDYARSAKSFWRGKPVVTEPLFLWGVDKVNPDPEVRYTKPITVLVNELDFSGGDFFPAILQDNNRAKIFGVRTSGAGGYVLSVQVPSSLGLQHFSFTGSLARRVGGQPIENLGVTPDVPYQISLRDLREGFIDYKNALNKVVTESIGKAQ